MNISWHECLPKIQPFLFKITTPTGSGTAFQMSYSKNKKLCGIATAYHVISHEHEWGLPIKLTHHNSKNSILLNTEQRAIYQFPNNDLAFILFEKPDDIPIKEENLGYIQKSKFMMEGSNIGWYGFPSVASNELCFFSGHISCALVATSKYLVDGVAINGISGGPVFYLTTDNDPVILGVISAYISNTTGETPGLSLVSSIEPYQDMLFNLKSLDEAKEKAEEIMS